MNTNLPTNVTAGTPDLPGMLNESHDAVNTLSRDTGWRDLSTLLINGWTATHAHVRRVNTLVEFRFTGLTGGTNTQILEIGGGAGQISNRFFPDLYSMRSPHYTGSGVDCFFTHTANYMFCFLENGTTETGGFGVSWVFNSRTPWPTSLPPAI